MSNADSITLLGLVLVLGSAAAYIGLLFIIKGFTYQTWVFHAPVAAGMLLAVAGWLMGGNPVAALVAVGAGVAWFLIGRRELKLFGSKQLRLRTGDAVPAFSAVTTDDQPFTEQDLIAAAPALLVLYRGWWCPSSKVQLDEISRHYDQFAALGVAVFAGSVDSAAESAPLQRAVGARITILGGVSEGLLEEIGVRDERGAPWYDRFLFHAPKRAIAMPSALVVDGSGTIVFAHRSARVDDRPRPADILATVRKAARPISATAEGALSGDAAAAEDLLGR